MKYNIIICILCTFLTGCSLQKGTNVENSKNNIVAAKKLDKSYLKKFRLIKKENVETQFIENDSIFILRSDENIFYLKKRKNNEKFVVSTSYFKNSLLLQNEGMYFYDLIIGVYRTYNNKGVLIKEINYCKDFPFSVYDLIDKINKVYSIDLNTSTKVIDLMSKKDNSNGKNYYNVLYRNNKNDITRSIAVDGKTGEIFYDGVIEDICPIK